MSNQNLNELRDINKQIEQLQNQKHIIQQKLQDQNDMMMVENHLFSKPEIQELIHEIEKDFPDFKINIDYKENKLKFICKDSQFQSFPEKFNKITKNDILDFLATHLKLKPVYMILMNSGFTIKQSSSNHRYYHFIQATNKEKDIQIKITFNDDLTIHHLKIYKTLPNETRALFKLKKYNVEIEIESDHHYNEYNGHDDDDLFSIYVNHYNNNVDINNLQEKIQNGIQILENAKDVWENEW